MNGRLIWVSLPRACCGLLVERGRVVAAAPYLRQFVGLDEHDAAARLRARGAVLVAVDERLNGPRS